MKTYTVELHYIGVTSETPQPRYHLVNNDNRTHEYVSSTIESVFDFCLYSEPRITNDQIYLLVGNKDKEKWDSLVDIYKDYFKRVYS